MATHEIRLTKGAKARDQKGKCHNRWHPDIPPILHCRAGDEIIIETRDAVDGQITRNSTHKDLEEVDRSLVHPLTGPIHLEDAEPGDLLAVELLEMTTSSFGYTAQFPGFGFLADEFPEPFLVRWEITDGVARSTDLPGVRIPQAAFPGTIGVAPSHNLLTRITEREKDLAHDGEEVLLPEPNGAVPPGGPVARSGLRTKPPRENGGNIDIRHAVAGSTVLIPVWVRGARLSIGDAHFAQGDGEACGTAIEVEATIRLRLALRKSEANESEINDVQLEQPVINNAVHRPTFITTGLSHSPLAEGAKGDLTRAAKTALRNMMDYVIRQYGMNRQQAYAICSVAVDLSAGQLVNSPNLLVTASLYTDIFEE